MAPLISWIASETARGLANYDYADVIDIAILLLVILTVLGLKEALLDIVAAIWSRFGHPDGRIRPARASPTCPRCGSRLVSGKEGCGVCAELGIPDMPPAPAWTPPAVDGGLPVEFVGSATWTKPDQGRDFPAEVARLRTSVALGVMVTLAAFAVWVSAGMKPNQVNWVLLLLACVDVMLGDSIRRLSLLGLRLAVVPAVLTAVCLPIALGVPALWGGAISILAVGGLAHATPSMALLRARRSRPKPVPDIGQRLREDEVL